ncbi:MAG: alpha/beta hydrolase [Cystobacterineae bacterium]|nr:alpha/beta hydrolase [Cystobacterineae bacterium]
MWIAIILLAITTLFCTVIAVQYRHDMKVAYEGLELYHPKTLNTEFGTMSYIGEGKGEVVLVSHGIFGGYDQGMSSLRQLLGDDCQKISISRFGYPGSELPKNPTPENQAKVFKELLDELGIQQAWILTTSAGGAAGFRFVLNYPERVKGLILLSSGVPVKIRSAKEIGMTGPPKMMANDFPMWFFMKYFRFIFKSMFGSEVNEDLYKTMLPLTPRKQGIAADTELTNTDMLLHYDEYPVEKIKAPILLIHAKDDPMVKYENIEKLLARIHAETAIFETGGHLISGHGGEVSEAIRDFIKKNSTPTKTTNYPRDTLI